MSLPPPGDDGPSAPCRPQLTAYLVTVKLIDRYWETKVYVKAETAGEAQTVVANKFAALSNYLAVAPMFLVVEVTEVT